MDPSCLVTTVQAGGAGSIVSDHVHPFMATSSRIMHHVIKLESFKKKIS